MVTAFIEEPGKAVSPAGATWDLSTMLIILLVLLLAGWAVARMARMRLLPNESKRPAPTVGRRSSAWAEAGRRLEVEPREEPPEETP